MSRTNSWVAGSRWGGSLIKIGHATDPHQRVDELLEDRERAQPALVAGLRADQADLDGVDVRLRSAVAVASSSGRSRRRWR